MFLEDELEYVRLKRNDNIMGWLAIVFVAALVFMFAGIMNSASATGSSSASIRHAAATVAEQQRSDLFARPTSAAADKRVVFAIDFPKTPPEAKDTASASDLASAGAQGGLTPGQGPHREATSAQSTAQAFPAAAPAQDDVARPHAATLADRDIQSGLLLISFALMGGSFVMLTFGGPRGGKREDEDAIDAL